MSQPTIAIIGAGNIGIAIANGLLASGNYSPDAIVLTRRRLPALRALEARGCIVSRDNRDAARRAKAIIVAVQPHHIDGVLDEIAPDLEAGAHVVISVVTGVGIEQIAARTGRGVSIVRAMPNTAIAVRESMTCLAANDGADEGLEIARAIFDTVGKTFVIAEEEMTAATALGACGVAFFLRAIRAASQGGIEIGFHSDDAIEMAAQTARGAATLLLIDKHHPEFEIDRVTTPKGCTIAGLNQMEHEGFSSAMIKGIVVSATKAAELYRTDDASRDPSRPRTK
jgi:pyrroline-5-carboxylate reductase